MSARFAFGVAITLVVVSGSTKGAECGQGCGKLVKQKIAGTTPRYFGNVLRDETIGIYVDAAGLASGAISEKTILDAISIWETGCPNDSIPKFESKWGKILASDVWKADPNEVAVTLSVVYEDLAPARLGNGRWRLADYADGVITIFSRCPSDWLKLHPERCHGTLVDWNSNFAKTVFAHEIGHSLQLEHDGCTGQLMQDGFGWGQETPVSEDHCRNHRRLGCRPQCRDDTELDLADDHPPTGEARPSGSIHFRSTHT